MNVAYRERIGKFIKKMINESIQDVDVSSPQKVRRNEAMKEAADSHLGALSNSVVDVHMSALNVNENTANQQPST